jgi:hypothetical protein
MHFKETPLILLVSRKACFELLEQGTTIYVIIYCLQFLPYVIIEQIFLR